MHDFGEGNVDCVIINARQLEGQRNWLSEFLEESAHILLNSVQALNLLVIVHEHVTVDFVNEDLVPYVRLDGTCLLYHLKQLLASAFVIRIVSVNNVDECTAVLDMHLRV